MAGRMNVDHITLGVCYYPEHWEKTLWREDLARMKSAGLEVIRIGDFSWNVFEPSEGHFDFTLFDEFVELAAGMGMRLIFCTPTAAPPAWLTETYPETRNCDMLGHPYYHGMRRHCTLNSPLYREKCARITSELAGHYGRHPAIMGWQIDNEFNCETSRYYAPCDHEAFRVYLKGKYRTLDEANRALGTRFWAQTYTSWEQICLSRHTPSDAVNPHLALEEKKFISHSVRSFCKMQSEILKKELPEDVFITTNGMFEHIDLHRMTEESLDFLSFDNYPNFSYAMVIDPSRPENFNDRNASWNLTKVRSVSKNFAILEQQAGPGGWVNKMEQPSPKPGQMRLWTHQAIAHGADLVSYFRWRTCTEGTEIYWHGLLDYSNRPGRRLKELEQVREDLAKIKFISGSTYKARAAVLRDWNNEWDQEYDVWTGPAGKISSDGWFRAFQLEHIPFDFIYIHPDISLEELRRYKCLVYPHAAILNQKNAELLGEYVKMGGTLIFGARTGYKDENGKCRMTDLPGYLGGLAGVRVSDFSLINPHDQPHRAELCGTEVPVEFIAEMLEPTLPGTEVLGRFSDDYYMGQPALTRRRYGAGVVFAYGSVFNEQAARKLIRIAEIQPPCPELHLPECVELAVREKAGCAFYYLLNYSAQKQEFVADGAYTDLLTGIPVSGRAELEPYGVMILTRAGEF